MNVLVTGINGFVGQHLAIELHRQGHKVVGTGMDRTVSQKLSNVVSGFIGECDLTNIDSIKKIPLKSFDAIINLAGLSKVGSSFGEEAAYNSTNVKVHTLLTGELLKTNPDARIIAVSTGAVYDNNQPMPLSEHGKLTTNGSPYVMSKIAMEEELSKLVTNADNVIIVRPFNHIGPGQLLGFLVPDLTEQIINSNRVTVGNLNTERDYTDVRDVVKAYTLLATTKVLNHKIYNICSGVGVSGEKILNTIKEVSGNSDIVTVIDKTRIRPNDPSRIVGDNSRIKTDLGWEPKISLNQTINDVIVYMRESYASSSRS